ncbi:unnamed protein product [Caenorhabditis auriculariae]|uniref:Uncharacterized protein n=1 Tax=Caenorhabditis auriculariae TaxID=2777116 RepID=A0A8S1HEI0_9PELO|nr:unnamed protein product [Caenorhabditis auriculariae]
MEVESATGRRDNDEVSEFGALRQGRAQTRKSMDGASKRAEEVYWLRWCYFVKIKKIAGFIKDLKNRGCPVGGRDFEAAVETGFHENQFTSYAIN